MQALAEWRRTESHWAANRAAQARAWFEAEVEDGLLARLRDDPEIRARMMALGEAVSAGRRSARDAAQEILAAVNPP